MYLAHETVDATDPITGLTIDVRVTNVWRLKLGLFLVKIAACVLRCPVGVITPGVPADDAPSAVL